MYIFYNKYLVDIIVNMHEQSFQKIKKKLEKEK